MSCDYEMVIWSMKTETYSGHTWRVMFGGVKWPPESYGFDRKRFSVGTFVFYLWVCERARERERERARA